jgi:hypothetical protein
MFRFLKTCQKLIDDSIHDNLDEFIRDYETFEEIPLFSRIYRASVLDKHMDINEKHGFMINIAFFYLNGIYIYARMRLNKKELLDFWACITFFKDDYEDYGFYVPHFLVTRKKKLFSFLDNKWDENFINDFPVLKSSFEELGLLNSFRFADDGDRIYASSIAHE